MNEKITLLKLKLSRPHPKKSFRLGKHIITHIESVFELNEKELIELESKGCKAWIKVIAKKTVKVKKAK